ncbi:MAG TPA: arabinosyltransferase domain-containing protein [Pseudonocardiaceae bacterium]
MVRPTIGLLVGVMGVLVALAVPFAPVNAEQTTVTWPAPGQPAVSSTAFFAPYRPAELTATVPCSAIRAAADSGRATTVLRTAAHGEGLELLADAGAARLLLNGELVSTIPLASPASDCATQVDAGPAATVITIGIAGDARTIRLAGEVVPKVFVFSTDLDATQATGMAVTARTASPFATSPATVKMVLLAGQLLATLIALRLLARSAANQPARTPGWWLFKDGQPGGWPSLKSHRWSWRTAWVDLGVLGVLAGWAVIGPLTDDDGFATTIARNAAQTGNVGNYYRWWNASETPFALTQQLLAPLTEVSLAPLWLRLPSTALAIATWFVVSRGVLGAALPAVAGTVRIRLLAAVCLLAAWLPFNLGVRPEPYVALGVTSVLALLWRAREPATVGWAVLVAGLTITTSPSGLLVAAPILVFAPRIVAILRASARGRADVLARVTLLCCIGAVGLTVVFADQTWHGLVTATRWHTDFGPSLAWYQEPDRYRYLLGDDQDGAATKRIPVLLTLALLPVIGLLLPRRGNLGGAGTSTARPAPVVITTVVITALALLWLTPSKWSHHFGAMAGVFASFLVVAVVVLLRCARAPDTDRVTRGIGLIGGVAVAAAVGLSFSGPNAWWQPAVYDVAWAASPVRPIGIPLDSPLLWVGALALGYAVQRARRPTARVGPALVAAPAVLTVAAAGTAVAVLLTSFLAAPLRRPTGSLALINLHRLTGGPACGLADDIQVLPDGDALTPANSFGHLDGFADLAGFDPDSPPPNPPGAGMSTQLWGSLVGGPQGKGTLTSAWFTMPALGAASGVAVSVSGRTDGGNTLILEFGRAGDAGVTLLAHRSPVDWVRPHQDRLDGPLDYRPWRSIGLDADQIPPGADRVRIRAVDATTDPDGWLAVTGPRLRSVVGLNEFLADRGPVLVSWPQAFLFPCVRDIAEVADGLAHAPRAVIEAPRRHGRLSAIATDQSQGGVFAALRPFGRLYEVPTRLAGHPGVDWGALHLPDYPSTRDTYQRTPCPHMETYRAYTGFDSPERSPCRAGGATE